MPELPDVEGFRRYIERTSLHQAIKEIDVRDTYILKGISPDELIRALTGRRFESTRRHGKYLFLRLDNGRHLYVHFGMTGQPAYFKDMADDPCFDRLLITFTNGHHLAYDDQRKLGRIGLTDDPYAFLREKRIGPDALSLDYEGFVQAFKGHRGAIKPALLNQGIIAGIGNIYADEILFQARIHPLTPIERLNEKTLERLFRCMREVLETGIEHTVEGRSFPDSYLIPHRGRGEDCPCGGKVESIKISQRTAYFCPACQSLPYL